MQFHGKVICDGRLVEDGVAGVLYARRAVIMFGQRANLARSEPCRLELSDGRSYDLVHRSDRPTTVVFDVISP
jgi:hypothetical protein